MNESERKIEIFKPFGEAFELTKKILFQPFDIGKWFVIGFAAFLANLSGGMNFNFNPRGLKDTDWHTHFFSQSLHQNSMTNGSTWPLWLILLIALTAVLILALVVALLWVGARGRFIFVDCIVKNRGAIVEPWHEYRVEGNSFFFFSLLVGLIALAIVILATLPMVIPAIMHGTATFSIGMTFGVIFLIAVVMLLAVGWALISQLMVPVMYRQRCRAMAAFRQVLGQITAYPGPFILYFLFYFVLIIAVAIIGCVSVCLTCCVTAIPYIGTVILLPIPALLQSFTLLFVRQFGPDYDAWGNIAPPEPPPVPEALPA
jgi:hypothetical protein